MKQTLLIVLISIISTTCTLAQVQPKGYEDIKWGSKPSKIKYINCTPGLTSDDYKNCTSDSSKNLFGYPVVFYNYRFYKNKLVEVNIDFDRNYLAYVVSKFTIDLDKPIVKEKETNKNNRSSNFTLYEWTLGDTKVTVFDKGVNFPVWCTISGHKLKKKYGILAEGEIDKVLFEYFD